MMKTLIKICVKLFGIKFMSYILGIKLDFKPIFGNAGISKTTYLITSCHPLDSITWVWAVYWTKYSGDIKWFKRIGLSISTQQIMRAEQ